MLCNSDFSERLGRMGVRDLGLERGRSCSGYRTIHDFMVQRGRSTLWIPNHPRFNGSAWKVLLGISNHPRFHGSARKVPALDIEPSTISRFSVESHALDIEPSTISWFSAEGPCSGYRTIHDIVVQRGRSPLWIPNHPRFHGSAWKVLLGISNHPRFHGSAWKVTALEAVTKRAERADGGTHAACFEQPEGVYSGCVDARPAKYASCYSIYIRPRYEA